MKLHTKKELIEIAGWYGIELSNKLKKDEMIEVIQQQLDTKEGDPISEDNIPMSVRVRRIKEQSK